MIFQNINNRCNVNNKIQNIYFELKQKKNK